MNDFSNLGSVIRCRRQQLNMTQGDLANSIHISVNYISHIENGKKIPTLNVLIDIAHTLQCSVSALVGDQAEYDDVNNDLNRILLDCSPEVSAIIIQTAETLKETLAQYQIK